MKTRADVQAILDKIRFRDRAFRLLEKGDGFLLQLQYYEPDVDDPSGTPVLQRARKWYISPWMTETEIVETAFLACLRSMEHVTREHFTYEDERIYSRHLHLNVRLDATRRNRFDRRPDARRS